MRIDWWTLALQTINLLVLLWILARFLFRPMVRIVADRQAAAQRVLDDADAERAKAQEAAKSAEEERKAVVSERAGLIDAARKEAEQQRASMLAEARKDIAEEQGEAREAIARMRSGEEERAGRLASSLATDIAARLLQDPAQQLPLGSFVERFEKALGKLARPDLEALAGPREGKGGPMALAFAREPDETDLAACHAVLAKALGSDVEVTVTVEPSLLAGLRLTHGDFVIDASLSADLGRIRERLEGDGG